VSSTVTVSNSAFSMKIVSGPMVQGGFREAIQHTVNKLRMCTFQCKVATDLGGFIIHPAAFGFGQLWKYGVQSPSRRVDVRSRMARARPRGLLRLGASPGRGRICAYTYMRARKVMCSSRIGWMVCVEMATRNSADCCWILELWAIPLAS